MPAQPSNTESALNTLVCAAQQHLSSFIQTLPLRDADIADMQRALLGAPGTVGKLAQLQDDYLQQWVALFRDGERAQVPQTEDRRFSSPQWDELEWFRLVRRLYDHKIGFQQAGLEALQAATKAIDTIVGDINNPVRDRKDYSELIEHLSKMADAALS